ncbi:MAG: hypothetical protein AB7S26_24900 [Sandaracinaceae bacterium]
MRVLPIALWLLAACTPQLASRYVPQLVVRGSARAPATATTTGGSETHAWRIEASVRWRLGAPAARGGIMRDPTVIRIGPGWMAGSARRSAGSVSATLAEPSPSLRRWTLGPRCGHRALCVWERRARDAALARWARRRSP